MSVIQAIPVPSYINSAAGSSTFASVLNFPANLTNRSVRISARGTLNLPIGEYQGYASFGLIGPDGKYLHGASAQIVNFGPAQVVPFGLSIFVLADAFQGAILDCAAGSARFAPGGPIGQSGSFLGSTVNSDWAASWGGGAASFSNPTPLQVQIALNNQPGSQILLPTIRAVVNVFELEY
jgi:hypothetical protein